MFERFTDRARRVVILAQEEARMLDHNYIGTEHVLLGLIHESEGVASRALESLGVTLQPARDQVQKIIGRGKKTPSGPIPFTPRAKKVLELSLREALQLGDDHIGTEHILLGLLREGEGVAVQILVAMGVDLNHVRRQVIQMAKGEGTRVATPVPAGEGIRVTTPPGPIEAAEAVARQQMRVPLHVWMTSMQSSLDRVVDRLEAIERHLGLKSSAAEADAPPGKAEGEPAEPEGGESPSGE